MTILVSGFVSVTLTPMLCSRLIKPVRTGEQRMSDDFYRWSEQAFNAMQRGYARSLRWSAAPSARHRSALFVASLVATVGLFRVMPQDFLPTEISASLVAFTEGANGISFAEMERHQDEAAQIVWQ